MSSELWALPIGCAWLGANYLVVRAAHFAVSDALLGLFIPGAVGFAIASPERQVRLAISAAFIGAAIGIKLAALTLVGMWVVAAIVCLRTSSVRRAAVWVAISAATGVITLTLLSPHAVVMPAAFWDGLWSHRFRFGEAGHGFLLDPASPVPWPPLFYGTEVLPSALGWVGWLGAIASSVWLAGRDWRHGEILLSAVVALALPLMVLQAQFTRYASPMIYPLATALGAGTALASRAVVQKFGWRVGLGLGVVAGILLVCSPLQRVIYFDRLLTAPDTREVAAAWVLRNNPKATVWAEGAFAAPYAISPTQLATCRAQIPDEEWHPALTRAANVEKALVVGDSESARDRAALQRENLETGRD